jgi:exodeoxyribonuclease VII large subunit
LPKRLSDLHARLDALDRTRQTLGYAETLRRGYAVVWGDGAVVTSKDQADAAQVLELEFHDGRITPKSNPKKPKTSDPKPSQGSLF